MGHRKRTDLLIEDEEGMLAVEVKSKQGREWPNCKGIYGNRALVLVDYEGKGLKERPDFYILTVQDWVDFVEIQMREEAKKGVKVILEKENNLPVYPEQILKDGKPYTGMGIRINCLYDHLERWDKIENLLQEE